MLFFFTGQTFLILKCALASYHTPGLPFPLQIVTSHHFTFRQCETLSGGTYRVTLADFSNVTLACAVYFLLPHARSHGLP